MKKLYLASKSPRRRELLKFITRDFEIIDSPVDEDIDEADPADMTMALALRKARGAEFSGEGVVIGADTIVYHEGLELGKPRDEEDARRMLRLLSGKTHQVYTGVALYEPSAGKKLLGFEESAVEFAPMTEEDIGDYLALGEYRDKAGAYGAQGYGARYIKGIKGCFFNVMGLPVHRLWLMLKEFGAF